MIDVHNKENDMHLMLVSTIEEFGFRHHISTGDSFELFKKNNVFELIRTQYEVMHTLPLCESTDMAESFLRKRGVVF